MSCHDKATETYIKSACDQTRIIPAKEYDQKAPDLSQPCCDLQERFLYLIAPLHNLQQLQTLSQTGQDWKEGKTSITQAMATPYNAGNTEALAV